MAYLTKTLYACMAIIAISNPLYALGDLNIPANVLSEMYFPNNGSISDHVLCQDVLYLENAGFVLHYNTHQLQNSLSIPAWFKQTAYWWFKGKITNDEFINNAQWLTNESILQIPLGCNPVQHYYQPTSNTQETPLPVFNDQSIGHPANLQDLYSFALNLVNADRKAAHVNPVALSNINSAQYHADDQLNYGYFSHWNSDGVKPYVPYTELGGRGSVAENDYYTYSYCPASNCIDTAFNPYTEITKGENEMMNNDSASNWGHRNNILDPNHTHVNFGIAYNQDRFYFVENFEDNLVNWQTVKLVNNTLIMVGNMQQGYYVDHIDVFSDPSPKILNASELDNLPPYDAGHYDQGNGSGVIVPKLSGNMEYHTCSTGKITVTSSDGTNQCLDYTTYENYATSPNSINISVDVSKWTNSPGLHTIYLILNDNNGNQVQATSLTLEYLK